MVTQQLSFKALAQADKCQLHGDSSAKAGCEARDSTLPGIVFRPIQASGNLTLLYVNGVSYRQMVRPQPAQNPGLHQATVIDLDK
jgi:hypothetical protein